MFTDASVSIYGFSCYCRYAEGGEVFTQLLFSKVKNAPKPEKTMPTLELLAVVLALKCLPSILEAVDVNLVDDVFVGIDAQVVLSWILSGKVNNKNKFAQNRIKDVTAYLEELKNKFNQTCHFRYTPTCLNVADLVTKGLTLSKFQSLKDTWFRGPEFIRYGDVEWPDAELGCLSEDSKAASCNVNLVTPVEENLQICERRLVDPAKFSDINKTFRITAFVLKFIDKCRGGHKSQLKLFQEAKLVVAKNEQLIFFPVELSCLTGSAVNPVPPLVSNLNLFLDKCGIIRSGGRLGKSDVSYEINNPILVSQKSPLAAALVWDSHYLCKHMGSSTTWSVLRNAGWWIPRGMSVVKSVLKTCITCKKLNSFAFRYPKPNDYPSERMHFSKPYVNTGIDFTGSMSVVYGGNVSKMYLLVFTCLNIRAVHIEILPDMTASNFIGAFVRFANIYGHPDTVFSDNAATFIQSMKLVANASVDDDFQQYLVKNNVKHITIPVYSAWVGSTWERMIRTIKQAIHKEIGRKQIEYFDRLTLISNVQNSINSRPLCPIDAHDVNFDVITPNSFLKNDAGKSLNFGGIPQIEIPSQRNLQVALERRENLFQQVRERWYTEYLTSLRDLGRDMYQVKWENLVKEGQLVTIFNPAKPRYMWTMGVITELIPGNDGKIRMAHVRKPDRTTAVHTIKHLYPLELSVTPIKVNSPNKDSTPADNLSNARPVREAAVKCLARIKESS